MYGMMHLKSEYFSILLELDLYIFFLDSATEYIIISMIYILFLFPMTMSGSYF